ncbi:MAG: hypothetical protein R3E96_03290 [Planctomycetota bacterium]
MHVEFKPVTRGVKTESEVELVFLGRAERRAQPRRDPHRRELHPEPHPDEIEVNVGGHGSRPYIKATQLPEGVELAVPANLEIAVLSSGPRGDEGAAAGGRGRPRPDPPPGDPLRATFQLALARGRPACRLLAPFPVPGGPLALLLASGLLIVGLGMDRNTTGRATTSVSTC